MISFLSFSELFLAFNWANIISNLLRIWSGITIFSSFADCSFCATDSSLSNSDVPVVSVFLSCDLGIFLKSNKTSTILCDFL